MTTMNIWHSDYLSSLILHDNAEPMEKNYAPWISSVVCSDHEV